MNTASAAAASNSPTAARALCWVAPLDWFVGLGLGAPLELEPELDVGKAPVLVPGGDVAIAPDPPAEKPVKLIYSPER